MKICPICKKEYNKRAKFCSEKCRQRAYYIDNKERLNKIKAQRYREKHIPIVRRKLTIEEKNEYYKKYRKKYYKEHLEYYKRKNKEHYEKHKNDIDYKARKRKNQNKYMKKYYQEHKNNEEYKQKCKEYAKKYYEKYKNKRKENNNV